VSAAIRVRRIASHLTLAALSVAAVASLCAPAEAGAVPGITTGIAVQESTSPDAAVRRLWLDKTVEANADLVRIDVSWNHLVGPERPANPRDPADPAYDLSAIDDAVRDATQRGMKVLFTVARAPRWAEGPNRPEGPVGNQILTGAWRPNPDEYGNFATALARRYSGSFAPAGQAPLPRVRYFEAWNEPNQEPWIAPQWVGDRPEGPAIYRRLLNSFYDAVKGVNRDNTVISGGLLPFGNPSGAPFGENRIRPALFLRELFCLKGRRKLKPRPGCPEVHMDVVAHHPITFERSPTYSAMHPDDAAMSDFDRLERVLRAAEKAGVVSPRGKRPIWATEFWWISNPPSGVGIAVPERKQALFIEEALYVLWKQGVRTAIQYLIRDDPRADNPYKTGLFFADGEPKLALQAFSFPFVAERLRRNRVRAWGISPADGQVEIQAQKDGGWTTLKRVRGHEGKVFTTKLRGQKRMRAQVGGETSIAWRNPVKG
jgi:hypothetical protein